VSIIILPTTSLGVVTFATFWAGFPVKYALGAGGVSILVLSYLGHEWASAFRSRNRTASRKDEEHFTLLLLGVYLAAVTVDERQL
jgi:hypothetical protein